MFRPGVIVAKEKHTTRYMLALTEAQRDAAALALLSERSKQGYWYPDPSELTNDPPEFSKEEINSFKSPSLKRQALRLWKDYERDEAWLKTYRKVYASIQKAIENEDGSLAWRCLRARADAEYEEISIEPLEVF